jgi:ATP adenylyltransferase
VCPALRKKPHQSLSPPEQNEESKATSAVPHTAKEKSSDPFAPPYNENLYVGEVKDEEYGEEYVVLVSTYSISRSSSFKMTN